MPLRKIVEDLEKSRDAAFNFNSDRRSTLCCAFEAEIFMVTLATSSKRLYERLFNDQELDGWLRGQSKVRGEVFESLSPTVIRDTIAQSDWKEALKEGTIIENADPALSLVNITNAMLSGRRIMDSLRQCPIEALLDDVLKPALTDIRRFADKLKEDGPEVQSAPAICTMGYMILGCAQSACAQIVSGGGGGQNTSATLTTIDSCIYQIVTCLADIASTEPLAELFLAPLYALSVSLACTLRRYGKAQRRLEAALNVVLVKGNNALHGGYLVYSELLWVQLIQLRGSLARLHEQHYLHWWEMGD